MVFSCIRAAALDGALPPGGGTVVGALEGALPNLAGSSVTDQPLGRQTPTVLVRVLTVSKSSPTTVLDVFGQTC